MSEKMKAGVMKRGSSWSYVVTLGSDGPKRQQWRGGFRTKAEAVTARTEAMSQLGRGAYVAPAKTTVAAFLREWLGGQRARIRPATLASYTAVIEHHIIPRVGGRPLQELTSGALNKLYADLLESGRADGTGGLSAQTVKVSAQILKHALHDAVREQRLGHNPADNATPPRPRHAPAMHTWTGEQVRAFLDHVRGDEMYAAYVVSLTCGTRRGETLGLRWSDVDLERGRISITQTIISVGYVMQFSTPKTAKGRRTISLDPTTIDALRQHRTRQLERRLAIGGGYRADLDLVFAMVDGEPVHPMRLSRQFDVRLKNAGVPRIRFHDLRHTNASLMLAANVPAKVASERLGHSSIAITLDTYSHVLPGLQEDAADKVGVAVFGT
jgi:integrase